MDAIVRLLRSGEIRRAAFLLADAFAADPFIGYSFNARRRRRLALPLFFRAILHEFADAGSLFAVEADDGALVGVAAWQPPEARSPGLRSRLRATLAALQVRALFPRAAPRLYAGFGALAESHPTQAHWYLAFVGIDPHHQGQGLGSMLLTPTLEQADQQGFVCYLETPFPATLAFYRRLGFDQTAELHPIIGAPTIWTMTRPARPPATHLE